MSQTLQMVLISIIAGVLVASVVYALWGVVTTTIRRSRATSAPESSEGQDAESESQSEEQPE